MNKNHQPTVIMPHSLRLALPMVVIILLGSTVRLYAQEVGYRLSETDSSEVITNLGLFEEYNSMNDFKHAAYAMKEVAFVYWNNNSYQEAISYYEISLDMYERISDQRNIGQINRNLGMLYTDIYDFERSLTCFQNAVQAWESVEDKKGIITDLTNSTIVLNILGRYDESISRLKHALRISLELEDLEQRKWVYERLTETYQTVGNIDQLVKYFDLYHEINEQLIQKEFRQEAEISELRILAAEEANQELKREKQYLAAITTIIVITALSIIGLVVFIVARIRKHNSILIDKNKEIQEQKEDLERLNNAKSKFFSIIGHDVRGPMSGILGFHELINLHIKDKYPEQDDEELKSYSDELKNSCNQLLSLLDSLLSWAMKEQGLIPNNPEILDLKACIEENNAILNAKAASKKIDLVADVTENIYVKADRNSLMTILRNLTSNSLKFTPEGGKVALSAIRSNGISTISVTDTGVGMDQEKVDKLFEVDNEKTTRGTSGEKGFGLGLNMVHDFVAMNHGKISVQSEVGEGTTFSVELSSYDG